MVDRISILPAFKQIEYKIERPGIRICFASSFSCVLPGFKYIEYEIERPGIRICFVFSCSCVLPGFKYIAYEIEWPFALFQFSTCFTEPEVDRIRFRCAHSHILSTLFFCDVLVYLPVFHFQFLDAGGAMGASKSYSIYFRIVIYIYIL